VLLLILNGSKVFDVHFVFCMLTVIAVNTLSSGKLVMYSLNTGT